MGRFHGTLRDTLELVTNLRYVFSSPSFTLLSISRTTHPPFHTGPVQGFFPLDKIVSCHCLFGEKLLNSRSLESNCRKKSFLFLFMFFMEMMNLSICMAMADLCKVQTKTEEKWCPSYLCSW